MSDDHNELQRLNSELLRSLIEQDIDTLDTLLGPDFCAVTSPGAASPAPIGSTKSAPDE